MRKCSKCKKPGHIARHCPNAAQGGGEPEPARAARAKAPTLVSTDDVATLKEAVAGVLDALAPVDAQHRTRVIRSAMVILGEDAA